MKVYVIVFCLVVVCSSAAPEPDDDIIEGEMHIQPRKKACRQIGGKCIKRGRSCPANLPVGTPPGGPFCNKRRHCCYAAITELPLIPLPNDIPEECTEKFKGYRHFHKKHLAECLTKECALDDSKNRKGTNRISGNTIFYPMPSIIGLFESEDNTLYCEMKFDAHKFNWQCLKDDDGNWDINLCREVGKCDLIQMGVEKGHLQFARCGNENVHGTKLELFPVTTKMNILQTVENLQKNASENWELNNNMFVEGEN